MNQKHRAWEGLSRKETHQPQGSGGLGHASVPFTCPQPAITWNSWRGRMITTLSCRNGGRHVCQGWEPLIKALHFHLLCFCCSVHTRAVPCTCAAQMWVEELRVPLKRDWDVFWWSLYRHNSLQAMGSLLSVLKTPGFQGEHTGLTCIRRCFSTDCYLYRRGKSSQKREN